MRRPFTRGGGRIKMPPPSRRHPDKRQTISEKADQKEVAQIRQEWANERADVLGRFLAELAKPTGDGSKKRQKKGKTPWYIDPEHEAAIFSHLMKWKKGKLVDPDSGAHPLVHVAWRCLAIACQETGNVPVSDTSGDWDDMSCPNCVTPWKCNEPHMPNYPEEE